MKNTYLIFFLLFVINIYGQDYIELDTLNHYEKREEALTLVKDLFEKDKIEFRKNNSGKYKKELLSILEDHQESVLELMKGENLFFDADYYSFIKSSIDSVKIYNPEIKGDFNFFLSKSPSPNAISVGNNCIIVNIGLFKYLKNEHQLRSVLLHELAHELKDHSFKNITELAKNNISKTSQQNIKDLKDIKYNRGDLAFNKLKNILVERSNKSKKEELAADSLGLSIYSNLKWPQASFVNALKYLKEIEDSDYYVMDSTVYKRYFDLEKQPFKNSWLKREDFSAYNYDHFKEKVDKDSVSSHPETIERINVLKRMLPQDTDYSYIEPSETYRKLQKTASMQQVANLFSLKEYGASLYSTLILLEDFPESKYLLKYLGKNMNQIYLAQKEYKLNRYVEQLNPNEQSESYSQFLNFIWNLRLKEMKNISDYYLQE